MAERSDLRRVLRRAIARTREHGGDGPRPVDAIEALSAHEERLPALLEEALRQADDPEDRLAVVHLVGLVGARELAPLVRQLAFEEPTSVEFKAEAMKLLSSFDEPLSEEAAGRLRRARELVDSGDEPLPEHLEEFAEAPDAWALPTWRGWLSGAGVASIGRVEGRLGRRPEIDRLILEWLGGLGAPEAAALIHGFLEEERPRELAKLAKRSLHRLRSSGIDVDAARGRTAERDSTFTLEIEPDVRAESEARMSGIDGRGHHLVWILVPSATGGYRLLEAVVELQGGLRQVRLIAVARREFRAYLERLREQRDLLIVRVDPEVAAGVVARAARSTESSGDELSEAYLRWRKGPGSELLGAGDPVEEAEPWSSIYDRLPVEGVRDRDDLIADATELLGGALFSSWAVIGDEIEAAAREIRGVETSRILVDDDQKKRQLDAVLRRLGTTLSPEIRRRYRSRLEAMAWALWRADRRDEARRVLAAAVGFTEIPDLFSDHPFANALLHRGIVAAYQRLRDQEDGDAEGSRIVRP